MTEVLDQTGWNDILVDSGFVTVNTPCFFTFEATPTDVDIHFTTNAQIYGTAGKTLYIKNPHPNPNAEGATKLSYARTNE